jgi:hypothetical protein
MFLVVYLNLNYLIQNLKFNFEYDDYKIKIYNSYFRNKNLVFNNESTVIYHPFLSLNSIINVEEHKSRFIKKYKFK